MDPVLNVIHPPVLLGSSYRQRLNGDFIVSSCRKRNADFPAGGDTLFIRGCGRSPDHGFVELGSRHADTVETMSYLLTDPSISSQPVMLGNFGQSRGGTEDKVCTVRGTVGMNRKRFGFGCSAGSGLGHRCRGNEQTAKGCKDQDDGKQFFHGIYLHSLFLNSLFC